jgi:hypothetical protein
VFPESLRGSTIDPYLLGLWESSINSPEPFRRFLYDYQVLEYAAFYHMKEEVHRCIRRVVASPDLPSRVDEATKAILEAVVDDRSSDDEKLISVVQQCVDPAFVWTEVAPKTAFFSAPTEFDGGISVPALIRSGWGLEDFKAAWIPKLPNYLRTIRNALVHAREKRQSRSIAPTARNQHLLRPWASLSSAIASQVLVYRDS